MSANTLFTSLVVLDKKLVALLETELDVLSDADLDSIQRLIKERDALLRRFDKQEIEELVENNDKDWQALASRTHKLVELATYSRNNIKIRIEKRGRGKRSIRAYKQNSF